LGIGSLILGFGSVIRYYQTETYEIAVVFSSVCIRFAHPSLTLPQFATLAKSSRSARQANSALMLVTISHGASEFTCDPWFSNHIWPPTGMAVDLEEKRLPMVATEAGLWNLWCLLAKWLPCPWPLRIPKCFGTSEVPLFLAIPQTTSLVANSRAKHVCAHQERSAAA